jgi:hypothetical protein
MNWKTVFGHGAFAGVVQEVVEVVTGGEDFGLAGDQDGADTRVLLGVEQGVGHRRIHGAGDGVLALEAVEFDSEDAVGFVGLNAHFRSPNILRLVGRVVLGGPAETRPPYECDL